VKFIVAHRRMNSPLVVILSVYVIFLDTSACLPRPQLTIITPTSRRSKRGDRRARQNKSPAVVVSVTPQQSFEMSLAQHTDSTPIRGKFVGTVATTSTPSVAFLILPANLGARVASISSDYLRYRIKWFRIRFLGTSVGTSSGGFTSMGVLDDVGYSGEPPTTGSGVSELRCSATVFTNQTDPTVFEYRPVDPKKWYYCIASSGNDRFDAVGTVYAVSSAATSVSYEVDYCVVFAGAFTTGAL
jgi:hypothetical protein